MENLKIIKKEKVKPTPSILDALKRDYPIEASMADLVDNSIDASAKKVLIRFITEDCKIKSIEIIDDGYGINKKQIKNAMRFAYKRKYGNRDLGMYGVGLKVASLSHANTLSVVSKAKNKDLVGSQWTTDGILNEDWSLNEIAEESIIKKIKEPIPYISLKKHGTIVKWDDISNFLNLQTGFEEVLQQTKNKILNYLGLRMHKLLLFKKIRINMVTYDSKKNEYGIPDEIKAVNPFPDKKYSAARQYPKKFVAQIAKDKKITLHGHIWRKKTTHEGYKLAQGKVAEHQGFYFFRNNRLITDGGWCNIIGNSEPHTSLARVEIHIPDKLSQIIRVQNNKARVDISPQVASALFKAKSSDGESLSEYIKTAEQIYRTKIKQKLQEIVLPGNGFCKKIKNNAINSGLRIKKIKNSFTIKSTSEKNFLFKLNKDKNITLFVPKKNILNNTIQNLLSTLTFFAFESRLAKKGTKQIEKAVDLVNACLK